MALAPIFNEQTPAVPQFVGNVKTLKTLADQLLRFVGQPQYRLVGLAANQLEQNGKRLNVNMCLVKGNPFWIVAINPSIVEKLEPNTTQLEGCLTWPNRHIKARRYNKIKIEYIDLSGNKLSYFVEGFQAQIWQHEINHLNGIEEEVV